MAESTTTYSSMSDDGLVMFCEKGVKFGLNELLGSEAEVLGKGTFGTSYKTDLGGNGLVAVMRLKGVCVSETKFRENAEKLASLVHANLLTLKAYYWHVDERLLVYDYMPMGSLSALLHGHGSTKKASLTWALRTKIAYGVACGVEFLHSQGSNNCHGNIKSSNVLLTSSYDAHVSDYGIANHLSLETKFVGLIATDYRAPEAMDAGGKVSQKSDVYSFGVLLLELLTGKDPIDNGVFNKKKGDGLAKWVRLMFQEKPIVELFDNELQRNQKNEEQMIHILQLAICCTFEYPNKRPSISAVTSRIKEVCGFGP